MTTVVVPLAVLMDVEGGIVSKITLKVSFISNILSSLIVTLNSLLIFPARKVIFFDAMKKSSFSTCVCIKISIIYRNYSD